MCRHNEDRSAGRVGARVEARLVAVRTRARGAAGRALRVAAALAVLAIAGCVQEMANQPRYEPLEPSTAFDDGAASRLPVAGTVARGQLRLDTEFYTGRVENQFLIDLPEAALADRSPAELLRRGRERYAIYCSHCHGQVGGGTGGSEEMQAYAGMVVQRGFPAPPTLHQERLRTAPLGYFFDVITNGFGRMPAHGYLIPPEDRWVIAAYLRALQFSQHAPVGELPESDRQQLGPPPTGV